MGLPATMTPQKTKRRRRRYEHAMSKTTYERNDVADELDALAVVGRTLAGLDPAARDRVLRWAHERFDISQPARPRTAAVGAAVVYQGEDPALSVEGVELFAGRPADADDSLTVAAASTNPGSVESAVRGFVTDFQRLVVEWQGA